MIQPSVKADIRGSIVKANLALHENNVAELRRQLADALDGAQKIGLLQMAPGCTLTLEETAHD